MKKVILMVFITGCGQDLSKKEKLLLDLASEVQNLEKLTQQQIKKDCKAEVSTLQKLGFTSETAEIMRKPEYMQFMKCAGKADKNFLAGILKKGKPKSKKDQITHSAALDMLNKAIFTDIQKLCVKEEEGFQRNLCHYKEIEKVRNTLGVK